MSNDRRYRKVSERDTFDKEQQRKRCKIDSLHETKGLKVLSPPACTSNVEKTLAEQSPWKSISNCADQQIEKENYNEFPPLTDGNKFDSWYTPQQPIACWADFIEEEESEIARKKNFKKKQRFQRKLNLCDDDDTKRQSKKMKERKPILTDEHRLAQRQKQIDYGKNTVAYGRYVMQKPRHCRSVEDPKTPDKFQVCSTRSWTGQVRCWRIKLHEWDPPNPMHGHGSSIFDLVSQSNNHDDVNSDMRSSTSSSQSEDFSET
ncbi:histone RNA hairpin-binding protein-like [Xenia sp. Carnegie-2017]|uniref:histone RNA hairpin-binding protein-like n=1 Tax=Xenia sp. Carnegie-2017 TaxID=2897299 RepID=UPI001F03737C|nr:histone RNA hairpin-binding protein-like [Xenia sp. Carnegie-2017]